MGQLLERQPRALEVVVVAKALQNLGDDQVARQQALAASSSSSRSVSCVRRPLK
jgi:hypothetical protein